MLSMRINNDVLLYYIALSISVSCTIIILIHLYIGEYYIMHCALNGLVLFRLGTVWNTASISVGFACASTFIVFKSL